MGAPSLQYPCKFVMSRVWLLSLMVYGAACVPPTPNALRLCTSQWPGYEPLYLARSLGYFADSEVQLVEYPSATGCMRAFASETVEAAALTFDEALELAGEGANLKVILVMNLSHGGNVVLARPEVRVLSDLKGKRVAVKYTVLGEFILKRALERARLGPADVHILPMVQAEHERAYREGIVDAVVTSDPARSRLLALGARQLFSSREIPAQGIDVLIVRQESLEQSPAQVKKLLVSWYGALDYLNSHPQDAAQRMAPRIGLSPDGLVEILKDLQFPSREKNRVLLGGAEPLFLGHAERLIKSMTQASLLSRPIELNRLLHSPDG